jgi:hypothetical protein
VPGVSEAVVAAFLRKSQQLASVVMGPRVRGDDDGMQKRRAFRPAERVMQ